VCIGQIKILGIKSSFSVFILRPAHISLRKIQIVYQWQAKPAEVTENETGQKISG